MSKETLTWLNQNTLIGFADKRGTAWHYRKDNQGDEPNHYPGAVPVADVERRLFHWDAVSGPVETTIVLPDGVLRASDPTRQVIVRPDTGDILGVFKDSYTIHQFRQWLLDTVGLILDDDLSIGSAGLLKKGAVAWVSVEVPDTLTTPEGVEYRPNLLACTSHDGTLATTFQRVVTNVVCDNTMSAALAEDGQRIKVKHRKNSMGKLAEVRDALSIVHSISEDFAAEVKALCEFDVSDREWSKFLDALAPVPKEKGRGQTQAINKQDTLNRLWVRDDRVSPWKNTAWGVVQAVNTYVHHEQTVRGTDRAERNMLRAVSGDVDKLDQGTLDLLATVV